MTAEAKSGLCLTFQSLAVSLRTTRFNIQKFCMGSHFFESFVRISEQTGNVALRNIKRLVFVTEVESVYSAVRTECLYK